MEGRHASRFWFAALTPTLLSHLRNQTSFGFSLFSAFTRASHSLQARAPIPTATFTRENGDQIRSTATAPTSSTTATCTGANGRLIVRVALALVHTATATNTPDLGYRTERMERGYIPTAAGSCTTAIGSTAKKLVTGYVFPPKYPKCRLDCVTPGV